MGMTTVISWNIAKRSKPWRELFDMQADVALLQEVGSLPKCVPQGVEFDRSELWDPWVQGAYDRWPTVVKLSDKVKVDWFRRVFPNRLSSPDEFEVSGVGTISAARVTPENDQPFVVVSAYARWAMPHPTTMSKWRVGCSDAAAHRILSDISAFIGHEDPSKHRVLVAGDFNNIFGATEKNRLVLYERDRTVFERMEALGLALIGPHYPNGRMADPTPYGLQQGIFNVPTWARPGLGPENAENQLDYVFASRGFHDCIKVKALNEIDDWGSSDHCRLLIEVD